MTNSCFLIIPQLHKCNLDFQCALRCSGVSPHLMFWSRAQELVTIFQQSQSQNRMSACTWLGTPSLDHHLFDLRRIHVLTDRLRISCAVQTCIQFGASRIIARHQNLFRDHHVRPSSARVGKSMPCSCLCEPGTFNRLSCSRATDK